VLYPTPRLAQAIYATSDPELHLALVQAYNDWIDEYASFDRSRFRALPILPNRGVDMALDELARVGERPSTGGILIGLTRGDRAAQPDDDRAFAAISERGLTMNIHVTLNVTMPKAVTPMALPAGNGSGRVVAAADQLTHLIFSASSTGSRISKWCSPRSTADGCPT